MHLNASLAKQLAQWAESGKDVHDVLPEAQRKGLVAPADNELKLTRKGSEFVAKWTAGKPEPKYERKPVMKEQDERQSQYTQNFQSRSNTGYRNWSPRG